ncbi:MAG: hypothetical protein HXY50_01635, partial [Ignavibacteriaceae bacterium]|nr:hypothetical protein [Ignavibacteriaceae bacterium]
MKRWKIIVPAVFAVVLIVAVLFMNKQKMAATTAGGIKDVYYVSVEKVVKKDISETLSLVGNII